MSAESSARRHQRYAGAIKGISRLPDGFPGYIAAGIACEVLHGATFHEAKATILADHGIVDDSTDATFPESQPTQEDDNE